MKRQYHGSFMKGEFLAPSGRFTTY
ncbi:hypothetical protein SPHINGO8AM_50078 [Sphingomonas sp. 8AM]|nr:hypothetical protein SPHINGO8AM_50078 [Sphingomonas sp. 8AM]